MFWLGRRMCNRRSLVVGRLSNNVSQQYQCQHVQVSFPLLLWLQQQRTIRRSILSSINEPPLDSLIPERPATIVLLEDSIAFDNNNDNNHKSSWLSTFQNDIPQQYGISFASINEIPNIKNKNNNGDEDDRFLCMLESLKDDLSSINHETILITRGPISSWCAVSYLESYPLQGLVMINPIQLDCHHHNLEDDDKPKKEWIQSLLLSDKTRHDEKDIDDWIRLLREAKNRTLQIEPGSVPMLILCNEQFQAEASIVSQRHSDENGLYGNVPVMCITEEENPESILAEINTWIDNNVL